MFTLIRCLLSVALHCCRIGLWRQRGWYLAAGSVGGRTPQLLITSISGLSFVPFLQRSQSRGGWTGVVRRVCVLRILLDSVNDDLSWNKIFSHTDGCFLQENDSSQVNNTVKEFVPPTSKVCNCIIICLCVNFPSMLVVSSCHVFVQSSAEASWMCWSGSTFSSQFFSVDDLVIFTSFYWHLCKPSTKVLLLSPWYSRSQMIINC